MFGRAIVRMLAAVALIAGTACYQDDTTTTSAPNAKPIARVLLTDAPFPYDSVSSVNLYVVRIEASARLDTTGGGDWVTISQPKRTFDLLQLQQGATADLGQGEIPAGQYHAIRMTIDTSLSSIRRFGGSEIPVNWNNYSGSNEMPLYASVDYPLNVSSDGAEIVIDFDVGRSFQWALYGTPEFTLFPWLRALSTAATGKIAGTVTTDYPTAGPVANASVTVCAGSPCDSQGAANVVASGRSDGTGHYTVGFVRAGTYTVRIERADHPWLASVVTAAVVVTTGATTTLSVLLPKAGSGGAYLNITGPTSVGVGGSIVLQAAVGDASGNPVSNPLVTWSSSDPAIAEVSSAGTDTARVLGRQPGTITVTASSGGLSDAVTIQVVGSPGTPVASVTVQPATANLAVGDSAYFSAELRDAGGNLLSGRTVSWFTADTSVFVIQFQGVTNPIAIVRPVGPGSGTLRATSEGKTGQASITVH